PSCVRIHDGRGWLLPLLFVVAQVAQAVAGLAHFLTGLALDLLALAFSLGLGIIGHVAPGLLGFPLELFAIALQLVAVVANGTYSFTVFAIAAAPWWDGQTPMRGAPRPQWRKQRAARDGRRPRGRSP